VAAPKAKRHHAAAAKHHKSAAHKHAAPAGKSSPVSDGDDPLGGLNL
jgi:hypothetical protein